MSSPIGPEPDSLAKSMMVERLAQAAHFAIRRYSRERGDQDVPVWDDLDNRGRNRVRALVVELFTNSDHRDDVNGLLEAFPHIHQIGPEQPNPAEGSSPEVNG